MSNIPTLLPQNATKFERALEQAASSVAAIPKPITSMWNPATCPTELLPWLAWGLSIDRWDTSWTEAQKRAHVASAIESQRHKGTLASVVAVLAELDATLEIVEWWQQSPKAKPFTFEARFPVNYGELLDSAAVERIAREISFVKPVRAHFLIVQQFASQGSAIVLGAARAMIAVRADATASLDTSRTWSSILQTEFGEPIADGDSQYLEDQ